MSEGSQPVLSRRFFPLLYLSRCKKAVQCRAILTCTYFFLMFELISEETGGSAAFVGVLDEVDARVKRHDG